jgi:hypothetical protein
MKGLSVVLLLLMVGMAWGAVSDSTFESKYNSTESSFSRSTTGYSVDSTTAVAANAVVTQTTAVASASTVTLGATTGTDLAPFGVYPDGSKIIATSTTVLYATEDCTSGGGDDVTLATWASTEPFATLGDSYMSGAVLPNGTILINYGANSSGGTPGHSHMVYKLFGVAGWTESRYWDINGAELTGGNKKFPGGYVDFFGWGGINGTEVVVGEYASTNASGNDASRVWYSPDSGLNWYVISQITPAVQMNHYHTCVFSPTNSNVIYLSIGDGPWVGGIYKLTASGSKTVAANWTKSTVWRADEGSNPTGMIAFGTKIILGQDGSGYSSSLFQILDTTTDAITNCERFCVPTGITASFPTAGNQGGGYYGTITADPAAGLQDFNIYYGSAYTGTSNLTYWVEVLTAGGGTGGVDLMRWSSNGGSNWTSFDATSASGSETWISNGLRVYFGATTGHTNGDRWAFTAYAAPAMSDYMNVYGFTFYNGVLYAGILTADSTNVPINSIMASIDGTNWVSIWDQYVTGKGGIYRLAGYYGGFIWGHYAGTSYGSIKFTPVTVKNQTWARVEPSTTNKHQSGTSSTDGGSYEYRFLGNPHANGWTNLNTGTALNSSTYSKVGTLSMCLSPAAGDLYYSEWTSPAFSAMPAVNQLVTVTGWSLLDSGATTIESATKVLAANVSLRMTDNTGLKEFQCPWKHAATRDGQHSGMGLPLVRGQWNKFKIQGKVGATTPPAAMCLRVSLARTQGGASLSDAAWTSCKVYIDGVTVQYNDANWVEPGFYKANSARSPDKLIYPLTGLPSSGWVVAFSWKPLQWSQEWLGNINIATIVAQNGTYLKLFWKQADSEFNLTDGTNTLATSTSGACKWNDSSTIKFIIGDDGSSNTVFNYRYSRFANATVTELSSATVRLTAPPVLICLGTDAGDFRSTYATYGMGLYSQVDAWNTALSSDTGRAAIFDEVGDLKPTYQSYRMKSLIMIPKDPTAVYDLKRR